MASFDEAKINPNCLFLNNQKGRRVQCVYAIGGAGGFLE